MPTKLPPKSDRKHGIKTITPKKMGAPFKDISYEQVLDLSTLQCTVEEMCAVLKCGKDLIYDRFPDALKEGREIGYVSLRRKMFHRALHGFNGEGDSAMLIWLSKQYLGHTDKRQDEVVSLNFNVTVNEVPQ
jgi:hypothetical protein